MGCRTMVRMWHLSNIIVLTNWKSAETIRTVQKYKIAAKCRCISMQNTTHFIWKCDSTVFIACFIQLFGNARSFGMNSTVGSSSPPSGRDIFSKTLTFFTRTPVRVVNECCWSNTFNISNVNLTSKISIPPEPVLKSMRQQMSGPDSLIG